MFQGERRWRRNFSWNLALVLFGKGLCYVLVCGWSGWLSCEMANLFERDWDLTWECAESSICKGGHPQFKSATAQYCGQPNRLRSCGLKKLRNCDCRPSKFDFRNFPQSSARVPVPLLSSPFSSAQDGLKINQKYLYNCLFLWKPKTCLKGTVARGFWPPNFFFMSRPDSTAKNTLKIAEMKISSGGLKVADFRKNGDCGSASF